MIYNCIISIQIISTNQNTSIPFTHHILYSTKHNLLANPANPFLSYDNDSRLPPLHLPAQ